MTVIVYDMFSVNYWMRDMQVYMIFERLVANVVWGLSPDMINIVSINEVRRLEELLGDELPEEWPTRASLRRLQVRAPRENTVNENGIVIVKPPTPLEKSGAKSDGKAGGPSVHSFQVHFQCMTGSDGDLAHRILRETNALSMEAITFELGSVLDGLRMPRVYISAVVSVSTYPWVTVDDGNSTNASNATPKTSVSLATSSLRPLGLFSIAWGYMLIGALSTAHVREWL